MGMRIGLISCTKTKDPRSKFAAMPAYQVYTPSQLFRAAVAHMQRQDAGYYILSALHGLLPYEQPIKHYEETLNGRSKALLRAWAERVVSQMSGLSLLGKGHVWEIHAGSDYSTELVRLLKKRGELVEQPVKGLSIGRRRGFYKTAREMAAELAQPSSEQGALLAPKANRSLPAADDVFPDVSADAPAVVRWPCVGDGPGVQRNLHGLWRAMPWPHLSRWMEDTKSSPARRDWLHPRQATRPDHERASMTAAVIRWCPIRETWAWTAGIPGSIAEGRGWPTEGTAATVDAARELADGALQSLKLKRLISRASASAAEDGS